MRFSACDTVSPVLCPARALLTHIPLGPRPWLHQLRSQLPGFVRRPHSYYGGGTLLMIGPHPLPPPPLAPPTPQPVARLCSSASQLLWRGQTSHDRTSSATAPRLPDTDQCSTHAGAGRP